ncbi:MAG TPA: AMP-binding protein, partial [Longimicrobiaceae bacterium]
METATEPGRVAVPGVAPARVAEWNRTEMDFPRDLCLHRLVEAQAARTPDAPAVEDDAGALTYAELDRRASRLAARLAALGVGPEARVGIFLERSAEMVVALLAVLKTGGAYLPLDPVYPPDRIAYVLEDAGARAILTQASLADTLPAHGAEVVRVDEASGEGAGGPGDAVAVSPGNAAYAIYTSGSTGRPKGVVVPHRAVVNFLATMRER